MIVFFLIGYDIVECLELLKVCNEQLMEVWLFFTHFYLTDCVQQPSPGWQRIADCRASGINHKKVNEDCKNINICLAAEFQLEREFCKENVLALICAQQSINQILVVCPSFNKQTWQLKIPDNLTSDISCKLNKSKACKLQSEGGGNWFSRLG